LKYLIVGIGNIGDQYENTRHNIGFKILDALAKASNVVFTGKRFGLIAETTYRGRKLILLKPTTYVNLSGKAVRYWLEKEKIPIKNLLIVVDDLALPFGILRLRKKGGDGGHNGLFDISQTLGKETYPRLRFGIGNDFHQGAQVNYVLSSWSEEEEIVLPEKIETAIKIIQSFSFHGIDMTMNNYNKK
jgi:PTH1 family peptidyl-tRNA hydrolase